MELLRVILFKLVLPLLLSGLILCSLRYCVQPITISTNSMTPTLLEGDRVIIERLYKILGKKIGRYDLIALVPPFVDGHPVRRSASPLAILGNLTGLPGLPQDPLFVRRVVALPGETVAFKAGHGVYINDHLLEETAFAAARPAFDLLCRSDISIIREGERKSLFPDDSGPIVVPAGSYFVLPDNRNNFEGSESWGLIDQNDIVGRVSHSYGQFYLHPIKAPAAVFASEKVGLNDRGVHALEEGDYTRAISLFNEALAIDPDYQIARDNLSIAYNNYAVELKDKPEAAIDKLHKALYIDPENALTRNNLNKMIEISGRDPGDFQVRLEMGDRAYMENHRLDALVEYREAERLKQDPALGDKIRGLETSERNLFPRELTAAPAKP